MTISGGTPCTRPGTGGGRNRTGLVLRDGLLPVPFERSATRQQNTDNKDQEQRGNFHSRGNVRKPNEFGKGRNEAAAIRISAFFPELRHC